MPDLASLRNRGNLAATHELYADGWSRADIAAALRSKRIYRVRQGWYIEAGTHPDLIAASRVGGRLTCGSALSLQGVWVMGPAHLHIAVAPHATQLRSTRHSRKRLDAGTATIHWSDEASGPSRLICDPITALKHLAECTTAELVGASADSVARQLPHLRPRIRAFAHGTPRELRAVLATVSGVSESGTEFLFRWRMRELGARLRAQVKIHGVGRVDFVIGECLVVEVDGAEFHAGREAFEADRRRDAALSARGFRTLRFSFTQVTTRWTEVDASVRAAVARGDHL